MQRHPLKYRLSSYTEGDFYQLIPVGRRPVAPGERLSKIVADVRFSSAIYDKAILTPVLAQAWAFYVPNRLVWDQWVDFIALDDAVTTVPTVTTAGPALLEPQATTHNAFYRRGYKLAYNSYFGSEPQAAEGAWFPNINDDNLISLGRLLVWDQYRASSRQGAYTPNMLSVPVSGASATINLDQLSRELRNNYARRRQKMTGDKYVDTMRLMGVELDWRVQMVPEFLGSSQQVVFGTPQQSANSADLTKRVTNWEGQHQLLIKRPLAFAEHGYLHVYVGFRPLIAIPSINPPEANLTTHAHYFRPDTAGGPTNNDTVEHNINYLKGRNTVGVKDNGNLFTDASSSTTLYPDPTQWVPATGSGPRAVSLMTDFSVSGLTPVRSRQA